MTSKLNNLIWATIAIAISDCGFSSSAAAQAFIVPRLPAAQTIGDQPEGTEKSPAFSGFPASENQRPPLGFSDSVTGKRTSRSTGKLVSLRRPQGTSPSGSSSKPTDNLGFSTPGQHAETNFAETTFGPVENERVPQLGGASVESLTEAVVDSSTRRRQETALRSRSAIPNLADREIFRQRYPSGKVQIARHVMLDAGGNYINDGQWKLFDPSGNLVASGNYLAGEMEGNWERLHEAGSGGIFSNPPFVYFRGPFRSQANFQKGRLSGSWTIYDSNREKVLEIPYRDGVREGVAVWYYPGKRIFRKMQFAKGVPHGVLVEYNAQGKETRKERYIDGKKVVNSVSYYRPGRKRQESIVHEPALRLGGEDDWWEAKPAPLIATGESVQHGPVRSWYENGQTKMTGTLSKGTRIGQFVWWHSNGSKQLVGTYTVAGEKHDRWIWWHENGTRSIIGKYENDRPVGVWRWWDDQGQLIDQQNFDDKPELNADGAGELPPKTDNDFDSQTPSNSVLDTPVPGGTAENVGNEAASIESGEQAKQGGDPGRNIPGDQANETHPANDNSGNSDNEVSITGTETDNLEEIPFENEPRDGSKIEELPAVEDGGKETSDAPDDSSSSS